MEEEETESRTIQSQWLFAEKKLQSEQHTNIALTIFYEIIYLIMQRTQMNYIQCGE